MVIDGGAHRKGVLNLGVGVRKSYHALCHPWLFQSSAFTLAQHPRPPRNTASRPECDRFVFSWGPAFLSTRQLPNALCHAQMRVQVGHWPWPGVRPRCRIVTESLSRRALRTPFSLFWCLTGGRRAGRRHWRMAVFVRKIQGRAFVHIHYNDSLQCKLKLCLQIWLVILHWAFFWGVWGFKGVLKSCDTTSEFERLSERAVFKM